MIVNIINGTFVLNNSKSSRFHRWQCLWHLIRPQSVYLPLKMPAVLLVRHRIKHWRTSRKTLVSRIQRHANPQGARRNNVLLILCCIYNSTVTSVFVRHMKRQFCGLVAVDSSSEKRHKRIVVRSVLCLCTARFVRLEKHFLLSAPIASPPPAVLKSFCRPRAF